MAIFRSILALVASLAALLVAAPLLMLGIPFWLTAMLTRRLALALEPRSVDRWGFYDFDPILGWRPRANVDMHCLAHGDDVFHFVTGDHGWAGRHTVEESDVLFLGDSHAFGYGVDAERSYASIHPQPRVKPLGAPGYNNVQELLVLREVAPKLAGKLVIWLVYPGNDLADNLSPGMAGYRTPFVRETSGSWEIVTGHVSPEKWLVSKGRISDQHRPILAALHSPSRLAERAYGACAFILAEGVEVCRAASARVVVMTIPLPAVLSQREFAGVRAHAQDPDSVDPDYPDRQIAGICTRLGVRFVALKDVLTRAHFKRYDDHLTEAGHRVLADVVRRVYREEAQPDRSLGDRMGVVHEAR